VLSANVEGPYHTLNSFSNVCCVLYGDKIAILGESIVTVVQITNSGRLFDCDPAQFKVIRTPTASWWACFVLEVAHVRSKLLNASCQRIVGFLRSFLSADSAGRLCVPASTRTRRPWKGCYHHTARVVMDLCSRRSAIGLLWLQRARIASRRSLAVQISRPNCQPNRLALIDPDQRLRVRPHCSMRAGALGGNKDLFAGPNAGGKDAAAIYSLIGSAKINGIDRRSIPAARTRPYRQPPDRPNWRALEWLRHLVKPNRFNRSLRWGNL
jgi:hypothetical protein